MEFVAQGVISGEPGVNQEGKLRDIITHANAELADMGLDPTLSILDGSTYLPSMVLSHDEFDRRVETYETCITNGEQEKSKYSKMFQDATHALKEVQQTNPMLLRGDKNLMQRQLLEQQKTAKDKLKEANRNLIAYKVGLNNLYETHASMDVDKYHQVLMEVLDKKNNAYKVLQAILRSQ